MTLETESTERADVQAHLEAVLNSLPPSRLGEQMANFLIEAIPQLEESDDEDMRSGVIRSCVSNLASIWEQLLTGAPIAAVRPPAAALAWTHDLVHRGVDLHVLLRAYRLGHGFAEDHLERAAAELDVPRDLRWRVLAQASHYLFAYVDEVSTQLVSGYEQERARWVRGTAAARAELISAIIDREAIDQEAASKRLRYDVGGHHVALILWGEETATAKPSGRLEGLAVSLAGELRAGAVLTVPIGEHVVWAWLSGERVYELVGSVSLPADSGVRAAVGTLETGLSGMADSHAAAREARRMGELVGARPGTIITYRDAGLMALVSAPAGSAVRFAECELGELAADSDSALRLRSTLRVYLEEQRSPARTARRLGVHVNTVVYRVKQAEEILGHPLEERPLELEVALRLSEHLEALRTRDELASASSRSLLDIPR